VPPTRLHTAWLQAHAEWGPGLHEDGFGLLATDEVDSPAGFAAWVARLVTQSDQATAVHAGQKPCTYRWIVEGDRVLGGIALRHGFSDFVLICAVLCQLRRPTDGPDTCAVTVSATAAQGLQ